MKSFEEYRVGKIYDISDKNEIVDMTAALVGIKILGINDEKLYPIYYIDWHETEDKIRVTFFKRENKDLEKYTTFYGYDPLDQTLEDCMQRILKKLFEGCYACSEITIPENSVAFPIYWQLFSDWKIKRIPYGYCQFLLKEAKKEGEYSKEHPAIIAGLPKMLPNASAVNITDKHFIEKHQINPYVEDSKSRYYLLTKP